MDEITLKRAIVKADKVQKTIEAHADVWDSLASDIWHLWRKTKSDDQETREALYREYHAILAIRAKLQRAVNECKKAEEEQGYAAYPIEMSIKAAYDWMLDLDLLDHSRVKALGRV